MCYVSLTALAKRQFVKNPKDLQGDIFNTRLLKGERGLGFTIIGGDNPDEEFLQIKNVVRNGPAYVDGKLQTGLYISLMYHLDRSFYSQKGSDI